MSNSNTGSEHSEQEIIEMLKQKYGRYFSFSKDFDEISITYLLQKDIENILDYLGQLKELKKLNISHNVNLITLPDTIGNLTNLKKLKISSNNLNKLPNTIGNLTNLNYLDLSSNILNKLPEEIGNLIALERLDLRSNELVTLPNSFRNLTKVRHIELSDNNLSFLPDSFGRLINLESINLKNNCIIYLPDSFKNLQNLRSLDLRDNKLRSFSNIPLNIRESKHLLNSENWYEAPDYVLDQIEKMTMDFAYRDEASEAYELGVIELENEYNFVSDKFEFYGMYYDGERLLEGNFPLKLKKLPHFNNIDKNKTVRYVLNVEDDDYDETVSKMMADIYYHNNNQDHQDYEQFYKYYYENKKEFFKFYAKSPFDLAQQYIQDPNSLTKDERERLAWESNHLERHILEMKMKLDDPILHEIDKRLTLEVPNNKGLKLIK